MAKQPLDLDYASGASQARRDWRHVVGSALFSGITLVCGLFIIFSLLTPGTLQGGSMGVLCSGYCGASVGAKFSSNRPDAERDWSASLTGETPWTWKWLITSKWSYERMNLNWENWDEKMRGKGSLTVKLPSMEYSSASTTGVLTKELLSSWLTGQPLTEGGTWDEDIEAIFQCLQAAGNGTLPRPRHHTYRPPDGGRWSMNHFLGGFQFPLLPIIGWILVWYVLFAPWGKRRRSAGGSSPKTT